MNHFLNDSELLRYSRQMVIPGVDSVGQSRLKDARVFIVGLGGLGAPVSLYLAAAGVGKMTLLDSDIVEESNLQRQVLYDTEDIGSSKASMAKKRLAALNPHVEITEYSLKLQQDNALGLIAGHDLLLSCLDNRTARRVINSACIQLKIPWIDGAVIRSSGTLTTYLPQKGPCYACLHSEDSIERPPAEMGVWGAAAGVMGSLMAMEAIKFLLGDADNLLVGRMLWCDLNSMEMQLIALEKRDSFNECEIKQI